MSARPDDRPGDRPDDRQQDAPGPAHVVVLSGPSGVGKSTVARQLRTRHPEVWLSVSATTRRPRPGEVDGREYHFVGDATFERMAARGELLEWATFDGHRYGTPRQAVLDRIAAGVPVLLEIDLQGARQLRRALPSALQVFLAPPSWAELERRLVGRGTEAPDVVERRLALGRHELAAEPEFDLTIVNHDVSQVCVQLLALMGLRA